MNANENDTENMLVKYTCELCNYKCCKKSSWSQHQNTAKHQRAYLALTQAKKSKAIYLCDSCGKNFKHQSSYCRHKKICLICPNKTMLSQTNNINEHEPDLDKNLILMLIKQNSELMEFFKSNHNNITNNNVINNTNSNNNTFNLQFFLNETCKDAMNITEFVDSLNLQLSDLEDVGKLGYIEGISSIIIKNLKSLDETKRPVHCTDKKRETIYIKDQGQWKKEDENKTRLRNSIRKISHKNIRLISQFREKYPEYKNSESIISDKYNKMIIEAMGGSGDNTLEKEEKIMKNIAKNIVINK
jgi:hypothetical protein